MMAWEWSVYPRLSTNPMVAAGITDEPGQGAGRGRAGAGADDGAGWGMLQQVRLSVGEPSEGNALAVWPAASCLPLMCRRDGQGGFVWQEVNPPVRV